MSLNNVIDVMESALHDLKAQHKALAVPKQEYDVQEAINKIGPLLKRDDTYFSVSCQLNSFERNRPIEIEWNVYVEDASKNFKGATLAEAVNAALDELMSHEPAPQPANPVG